MRLAIIKNHSETPENTVYTKSQQLFFNKNRISTIGRNGETPATVMELMAELEDRSWLSRENKFIDWATGDLVLNTSDDNYTQDVDGRYSYNNTTTVGVDNKILGIALSKYSTVDNEKIQLGIDTTGLTINLVSVGDSGNNSRYCRVVFPNEGVSSINLNSISRKLPIPGMKCKIANLKIKYLGSNGVSTTFTLFGLFGKTLFYYDVDTKKRVYNTGEENLSNETTLSQYEVNSDFEIDLTNDGWLKIYPLRDDIIDCVIDTLDIKFTYD